VRGSVTFAGETERLLQERDLSGVLAHLSRRPGLLGRRLHELLRRFEGGEDAVFDAFTRAAETIPSKALLTLDRYFATINSSEHRAVVNKRGKLKVLANNSLDGLTPEVALRARMTARDTLLRRFRARGPLPGAKVWIDPELSHYTVPLQQRAT